MGQLPALQVIRFGPMPEMAPLAAGRSIYTLPIAGNPLYVHIIERAKRYCGAAPVVYVDDPALLSDRAAMADLTPMVQVVSAAKQGEISAEDAVMPLTEGDRLELRHAWDLLQAAEHILQDMEPGISERAEVEPDVEISGNVRIEANARVLNGARIKGNVYIGPGCMIGNGAMVRGNTSLAAGCVVGFSAEVNNSLLMERCGVGPVAFVADSLVDRDCFFGGTARVSNYRLDGRDVEVMMNGRVESTGRRQFGAIFGENAKIGIGSVVYPGRKIGANCMLGPNVNVVRNIEPGLRVELDQQLRVTPAADDGTKTQME
jgi:UDP-N-acetylglucosamine diphosphorylase / glucose-1-phosphate thymidylyltransferase / UDP-N-acetylgalactosamine diphosphorylase / glucosamine-1-phosphate N-acetyltransferase / galactosamine-1-phosphate N-acetyltransferase